MTNLTDDVNPEINEDTTIKELILEEKKQELIELKEMQENEIFEKIAEIRVEAIEKLKIVASIGSVAIGAYLVLKYFFGNKDFTLSKIMPSVFSDDEDDLEPEGKSSENFGLTATHTHKHSDENGILATFKREIALFLVSIAKQKIVELLAHLQHRHTQETTFEEENNPK